jgi:hypothetical protein
VGDGDGGVKMYGQYIIKRGWNEVCLFFVFVGRKRKIPK